MTVGDGTVPACFSERRDPWPLSSAQRPTSSRCGLTPARPRQVGSARTSGRPFRWSRQPTPTPPWRPADPWARPCCWSDRRGTGRTGRNRQRVTIAAVAREGLTGVFGETASSGGIAAPAVGWSRPCQDVAGAGPARAATPGPAGAGEEHGGGCRLGGVGGLCRANRVIPPSKCGNSSCAVGRACSARAGRGACAGRR